MAKRALEVDLALEESTRPHQHSSGWFVYHHIEARQSPGETGYLHCRLLRDLPFDENSARWQGVTFHQDARCKAGAVLSLIVESNEGQLVGWMDGANDDDDELVMDLFFK